MMNTLPPPMNPKVASLRREAMERRYQRALRYVHRLWVVVFLLLAVLVVEVGIALCYSPRFNIYRISASGMDTLSEAEIIRLAQVPPGTNYYRASLEEIARRIRTEPRVAGVQVRRGGVGVLHISLRERRAVCRLGHARPLVYLDAAGVVFARPVPPAAPVPVVEGLDLLAGDGTPFPAIPDALGARLTDARARQTLDALAALRDHQAAYDGDTPMQVRRLVYGDDGFVVMVLPHNVRVFIGRARDFPEKVLVARATIERAAEEGYPLPDIAYVDVRGVAPGRNMVGIFKPREKPEEPEEKAESTP